MNIECVIPAAGLSSRMGRWKLLLPYQGQTILDVSINHALCFCSRVIVVAGFRAQELIQRYIHDPRINVVINPHYHDGMFSSIQIGIRAVSSDYFFITHGDMPCINISVFAKLWQSRGQQVIFPGNKSHSGHPVLLPKQIIATILAQSSNSKMKPLIMQFGACYLGLTADDGIYLDIDTPTKYQLLLSQR